jgi:hypothetical protein
LGRTRNTHDLDINFTKILFGKLLWKMTYGRSRGRWKDRLKLILKQLDDTVFWIELW